MKILVLDEALSTMDLAMEVALRGDGWQGVMALRQTAGRGRQGRKWRTFDAPHGLAVTYIVPGGLGEQAALVVAWSVYRALGRYAELALKWPNDIQVARNQERGTRKEDVAGGLKVGGILCENRAMLLSEESKSSWMAAYAAMTDPGRVPKSEVGAMNMVGLVGVGINIVAPAGEDVVFADDGRKIGFLGVRVAPEILAEEVGGCIFADLQLYREKGWQVFHDNYADACVTIGQRVRWRRAGKDDEINELTGLARGLNQGGQLELVDDNGTVHVVASGEIIENR